MSTLVRKFASRSYSRNTLRAYKYAYRKFEDWLKDRQLNSTDRSLAEYLATLYESGLSQASCVLVVAAVQWVSRNSNNSSPVGNLSRKVLSGLHRSPNRGLGQVKGLTWKEADQVAELQWEKGTFAGIRNAALISMGSDALLRVSEIQSTVVSDLEFNVNAQGLSILYIPRSKTDQEGMGQKKFLVQPPQTTLQSGSLVQILKTVQCFVGFLAQGLRERDAFL